ncbi:hypothetical protein B0T16DRAFT_423410 [Cercophora newfieldiana]|uniref:Uncharacterized protein n=1 Tax=Cercophora newfieldiana TaxID=92897 RepID=A0AA39XSS5_9PEZI|nr:hypothetical protein B0T16DRAFT_423410 [Cercophora newfieldiana]
MSLITSTTTKRVTDADGWSLVGPLTTTFTPPASCTQIFSTSSNSLAFIGPDNFARSSCFPNTQGSPIRIYFLPGVVCPSGWTSELISGTRQKSLSDLLPSIRADETAAVCCPSGLRYAETVFQFAPGIAGWCVGRMTTATSIEPERCANCDEVPTPLPITNRDGSPMMLIQTTLLLRTGRAVGVDAGVPSTSASSTASALPPGNENAEQPPNRLFSAAKTGIVVGAIIGVILVAFALGALVIKRRRKMKQLQARRSLNGAKELHGSSAEVTELVGDTNPHMRTHELGGGSEVRSVVPVVYMEPVELDTTTPNRHRYSRQT